MMKPDIVVLKPEGRSIAFFGEPQPEVFLANMSDPTVVGMATRGYTGQFGVEISETEFQKYWSELDLTRLKTPLEMVHVTFLFRNVTRAFTHQLVRYRLGTSFVQESMRFSVQNEAGILVPGKVWESPELSVLESFIDAIEKSMEHYWAMIDVGVPTQDARAILPHAITTNVFAQFSLLALTNIYRQRTCCQAQEGEWETVMRLVKLLISQHSPKVAEVLRAPWEDPSCTGCGFGASFDRPCLHQAKFDANADRLTAARTARKGTI